MHCGVSFIQLSFVFLVIWHSWKQQNETFPMHSLSFDLPYHSSLLLGSCVNMEVLHEKPIYLFPLELSLAMSRNFFSW